MYPGCNPPCADQPAPWCSRGMRRVPAFCRWASPAEMHVFSASPLYRQGPAAVVLPIAGPSGRRTSLVFSVIGSFTLPRRASVARFMARPRGCKRMREGTCSGIGCLPGCRPWTVRGLVETEEPVQTHKSSAGPNSTTAATTLAVAAPRSLKRTAVSTAIGTRPGNPLEVNIPPGGGAETNVDGFSSGERKCPCPAANRLHELCPRCASFYGDRLLQASFSRWQGPLGWGARDGESPVGPRDASPQDHLVFVP